MGKFSEIASQSGADVLLIVPPFGGIDRASLGIHLLQASARAEGYNVDVLYANLMLASDIGTEDYNAICYSNFANLDGDRFFLKHLFEIANWGLVHDKDDEIRFKRISDDNNVAFDVRRINEYDAAAERFIKEIGNYIASKNYRVVGVSSTFDQNLASLSILREVKKRRPEITCIIGGANFEGPMASGLLDLVDRFLPNVVDYVFSGESEVSFPTFLHNTLTGKTIPQRILYGTRVHVMDNLPIPDYQEYYDQLSFFLPDYDPKDTWIMMETSRGCWWGQKHLCLFCGLNGEDIKFREKSPERVVEEIDQQIEKFGDRKICMVDLIMPFNYFNTLLPILAAREKKPFIFFDQKANLTLDRVLKLKEANISLIQPGIETLSTELSKMLKKGVTAKQNIELLRYAKSVGVYLNWNLLYGFPNDKLEYYTETLRIVKQIRHLHPPVGCFPLSIDRFSPYFENLDQYNIKECIPLSAYSECYPKDFDVSGLAYHFTGEYHSDSLQNKEVIDEIKFEIQEWRNAWKRLDYLPTLRVFQLGNDDFIIVDTRQITDEIVVTPLSREQATVCLSNKNIENRKDLIEWAIKSGFGLLIEGNYVPLAEAEYNLLFEIMNGSQEDRKAENSSEASSQNIITKHAITSR